MSWRSVDHGKCHCGHAKTHKHKVLVTTEIESSYDGRVSEEKGDNEE